MTKRREERLHVTSSPPNDWEFSNSGFLGHHTIAVRAPHFSMHKWIMISKGLAPIFLLLKKWPAAFIGKCQLLTMLHIWRQVEKCQLLWKKKKKSSNRAISHIGVQNPPSLCTWCSSLVCTFVSLWPGTQILDPFFTIMKTRSVPCFRKESQKSFHYYLSSEQGLPIIT